MATEAITDQDREYAVDLLDDLDVERTTFFLQVAAEWIRKVRHEAELATESRLSDTR